MSNTIVVLDDESTFSADGYVYVLKENVEVEEDVRDIEAKDIVRIISVGDLLLAYNKVHGTSY
jgi:hypothetical protein